MKKEQIKKWRRSFKQKNIKRFSLFLAIAFLFLMLTKLSETYTQTVTFNVELTNVKDEIVLSKDSNNTLDVVLNGKGFNLLPYAFYNSKTIFLDAKKDVFTKGKSFYWDAVNNRYIVNNLVGNAIDVRSVKPDTLVLDYDILKTKKVPVEVEQNITFVSGFDVLDHLKAVPDSIKIVGSEGVLKTINSIKTKTLNLTNVSSAINSSVDLDILKFPEILFIPNRVNIKGTVKRFTEGRISVPIEIKNTPSGKLINHFPKNIDVIYYVDLENFNNINSTDFKVIADFDTMKDASQQFLELELSKTSPLSKNTRLSQDKIEFIISE